MIDKGHLMTTWCKFPDIYHGVGENIQGKKDINQDADLTRNQTHTCCLHQIVIIFLCYRVL